MAPAQPSLLALALALASAASPPPCAPPALDPPRLARWGGDVAARPLAPGSPLSACAALCCASAGCVAFSFNAPQPYQSCLGGSCCEAGGTCCMLKDSPGTLQNNTFAPGQVTTGTLPPRPKAPGPTPPFPASALITNVSWGPVGWWTAQPSGGDTWPSAWAADGSTYAWDCDSHGSPMSLWRLQGSPTAGNGSVVPVLQGSLQPIDYQALCAQYGRTGSYPYVNVKPAGMVALPATPAAPNGTLLLGVSCMNYGDDAGFNRQHNLGGFLAASTDSGLTWSNVTAVGAFAGRLAAPAFVSCGQANAPCSAKDGGLLYVFFPGASNDEAYWDNNDGLWLGRVLQVQLQNVSAYEYYVGLDGAGQPQWSSDASQAQPSLAFGRMVGEGPVTYVPALQRYLFANFGFIDDSGAPRPWHTQPFMTPHRTQLVLLEAPQPWGPWSVFWRDDDSAQAPGLYTPTFPSQWVQERVGNTLTLGMAFACLDGALNCRYTLNYQALTLTLAETGEA